MTLTAATTTAAQARPVAERLATLALFLGHGFANGGWAAYIPSMKARLALTDASLSVALLCVAAGAVVSMPLAGVFAARAGSGASSRTLSVALVVALVLPLVAPNLAGLCVAGFLFGAANGSMDVCMNVEASFVERRWGAAIMSSFHAAWSAGGFVLAGLATLLLASGGDPSFILIGAAALAAVLFASAWMALGRGEIAAAGPRLAVPSGAVLPVCLAVFLAMLSEGSVADWCGVYLSSVVRADPASAVLGYASFAGSMLAARLVGDHVSRAFGPKILIGSGALMATSGMMLASAALGVLPTIIGFGIAGFGLGNLVPVLFSAAARLSVTPALGIAMAATSGYTGFLIGPVVMGGLATAVGLQTGMLALAVFLASVALMSLVVKTDHA